METNNQNIPIHLLENERFKLWCDAVITYYDTEAGEEPIMTDSEFDSLQEELISLGNNEITNFINTRIYRNGQFEEKHYDQEMISLFKIKYKSKASVTEIKRFFSGIDFNMYYSPKFDGCSLKVIWENDEIKLIQTRGGIDVTQLLKDNKSIQDSKSFGTRMICGELLIDKNIFEKQYSSEVGGDYENPRNFVGGLVKKKSLDKEVLDNLFFVPCTDGIDPLLNSKIDDGTNVTNVWKKLNSFDLYNLDTYVHYFKSDKFPFLCDGIVIAYNTPQHIRQVKDNYPLNMVAVKFPAPKVQTEVIGFDWTQKKSGKLTPRLILKPVKLDGSTISFANGYNIEQVINNGIGIGSIVEIEKSGDIIPIVSKVIKRSKEIKYPDCDYKRIGKHLIAIDETESKQFKFIKGLELLQIQGIGEKIAMQIGNLVNYDILKVFDSNKKADFATLLGGGATWLKFSEIYNIKTLYLDELINILQFDNVGPKISKKIALLLMHISNDTSNISSDVLQNVCKGVGFQKIKNSISELSSYGIKVLKPVQINEETITFEMSGSPDNGMTKQEFEKQFKRKYPNAVHTTLSKTTKLLIVDSLTSNTSKALKARKYNIKIVTYKQALTD